jgi:hypothetical protein
MFQGIIRRFVLVGDISSWDEVSVPDFQGDTVVFLEDTISDILYLGE